MCQEYSLAEDTCLIAQEISGVLENYDNYLPRADIEFHPKVMTVLVYSEPLIV